MIRVGEVAPDFELEADNGTRVRLYRELEQRPVVLFFYLRDATPG